MEAADEQHVRDYVGRDGFSAFLPVDRNDPSSVMTFVRTQLHPEGNIGETALALAIVPGGVGQAVGTVTVTVDPFPVPVGWLSFNLDPEHRGKGYMTEALEAVLPEAIMKLGILRLCSAADVEDVACQKLLERVGMSESKRLSGYRVINGESRDAILYALERQPPTS